ncbi:hypothetical protein [Leclercia adecarboxylata]|uniref:hypothetical protein n=1 Tax=Leclercia adecarboxylata TaxID=83655 RepID=UPI002B30F2FF|nr:hypothetical protein NRF19_02025 [Leclercia adecarboxylata]
MDKPNNNEKHKPILDFNADEDAVSRLHKLTMEMQDLCTAHNIPMVAGFCIEVQDGLHGIVLSSYIDSRKTPAPMNMLGAVEMLKSEHISPELVKMLEVRNNSATPCDCESCRARAESEREDESDSDLRSAAPGVVLH